MKQRKIGNQLTQLNIEYKDSPIINYESKSIIKPGQRAPDVRINQNTLYQYLNNTLHNILIFLGKNPTEKTWNNIAVIQKFLKKQDVDLFKLHLICKEQVDGYPIILDKDFHIHDVYQIKAPSFYIIRPDTYIAYIAENFDMESLEIFLKKYLD